MIITGGGASGKNYMVEKMKNRGMKFTLSTTTRPQREGEVNGVDYNFISEHDFQLMILSKKFQQWKVYTVGKGISWYYGTTWETWNRDDIFILTPAGIADIDPKDRKSCFVIYLDIDAGKREDRMSKRNDADSTERRMEKDREDFKGFTDFDIRITDF